MSESVTESGSDMEATIAGQQFRVRNIKSLNTLATVVTTFLASLLLYITFTHQTDTKEGTHEFVKAIKEQTVAIRDGTAAQREQTCMLKFEGPERKVNSEWCKQVSGSR